MEAALGWCLDLPPQPPTPLDSFAAMSGLCALAELLHLLVPGICRLHMAGGGPSELASSAGGKRQVSSAGGPSGVTAKSALQQLWSSSVMPQVMTPAGKT